MVIITFLIIINVNIDKWFHEINNFINDINKWFINKIKVNTTLITDNNMIAMSYYKELIL